MNYSYLKEVKKSQYNVQLAIKCLYIYVPWYRLQLSSVGLSRFMELFEEEMA